MLPRPFHMAKEQGANKLLTNCPSCILSLEQGRELMREAGEPMECGIFDLYKVFSRALVRGMVGQGRVRVGGGGCCPAHSTWQRNRVPTSC